MATMPAGFFSRFNPADNYERILFRAGKPLQSAELNELQEALIERERRFGNVFLKDGAIIEGAGIRVDASTGLCNLENGALYLRGAVRGVAPGEFTIPVVGEVVLGIYLLDVVVTENEDETLRDPALGARAYGEPGAARLQVNTAWGIAGDGSPGEFYPVWRVVDGNPESKDPPPQIDAVSVAVATYDRQSAGGFYVSSGLRVTALADEDTNQIYNLSEGVARVNGREVQIKHSRRVVYPAVADLKQVLSEPHTAAGGTERVDLNHSPLAAVDQVLINAQKTVSMVHGAFSGAVDALPDSPVLSIVSVSQGGTNYTQGTDFKLTSDAVDWSLPGAEPAPGSTYSVTYRYVASVTPSSVDATGFTISGAVAGSVTQVSYRWKRPRIDRLCLDSSGFVTWVQGVPNDTSPITPPVPEGLLALASVRQTWSAARSVSNDGTRMVPMGGIEWMQRQIDDLFNVVSDQQLQVASALSDPTTKKGIFTDAFVNDDKRDAGLAQNAAVYDGILTLPMSGVAVAVAQLADTATLPLNTAGTYPVIQQPLKTGEMLVNPYQAFEPIPAAAALNPATDFWTDHQTAWASPITRRFEVQGPDKVVAFSSWGLASRIVGQERQVLITNTQETLGTATLEAQFLRQITVQFTVNGFGPGEWLDTVKFDGRTVSFQA